MAIVSISRIQHRRGLQQDLPLLASAELGWSLDTQKLYIGNGSTAEGAPRLGITEILTEHSDILALAETYTYQNEDAGYTPNTGGKNSKLNALAYGASTYVAVGVNGSIVKSVDTQTWTPIYGGTSNTLNSICFGNGLFVAVGAGGTIIYSVDGSVWNKSATTIFLNLTSVCYYNYGAASLYIATSDTGAIVKSVDAVTWSVVSTGVSTSLNSISTYLNMIIAVGNDGLIISSTDTINWTVNNTIPTSYNLRSVKYINDRWFAIGEYSTVLTSTDGSTWVYGFTDTFRSSANNNLIWVFVGDGGIIYNVDTGSTTPVMTTSPTQNNLYSVIFNASHNQFVAVGANGTVLTSSNGIAWYLQTTGTSSDLNQVVYDSANSLYIAVGNSGTILTSSDGANWTARTSNTTNNLYGIAIWTTTTTYIVVGAVGTVVTSPNGTNWTMQVSGLTRDLKSITIALNRAVAVGTKGTIATSDVVSGQLGNTWIDRTGITTQDLHYVVYQSYTVNSVVYNDFFAVGNNAIVISSADGLSWFTISVPSTNHLFNINYGLNNFWILGSVGYSTIYGVNIGDYNTLNYQSLSALQNNTVGVDGPAFYSGAYGDSRYIIVGQFDSILASSDGTTFVSQPQRTFTLNDLYTSDITDIVYDNNMFTAVGNKGLILNSTDTQSWAGFSYTFGNSKTVRTIQKKLDDFVSVKDFGAKGDGVTDDTEAINRALFEVYCRTASPSAKKILYFPAGKYKVSDGINVPSDATIKGEGINNTIITQTANPNYVSYVMTTADNKQQIGAQIGYNGASLPHNITIIDMTLEASGDGFWLDKASSVTLDRVGMTGINVLPTSEGNSATGIYIIGSTLSPPTDINIVDCNIEKFNYGILQEGTEYSRNIVCNSTTFSQLFKGIMLCDVGGMVNTMTVSNCVFDLINSRAIDANYVTNLTSTFNSYRDVANNYLGIGNAIDNIINFGQNSVGCASINDQFDRTQTESYNSYAWVYGNSKTVMLAAGHELRIGLWEQASGSSYVLSPNETNQLVGLSFNMNDLSGNQKIQYLVKRGNYTRSGIIFVTYNSAAGTFNIDDDSSETGDVGVIFSLQNDGSSLDLLYTSTSGGSDFTLIAAESYLDVSW
jgi:hypothetical protein